MNLNKPICVKTWHVLLALVIIVLLFFFLPRGGGHNKYEAQLVARLDSATLASQQWEQLANKRGDTVQLQLALVVNNQHDIQALTDSIFDLKRKQARQIKNIIAYYSQKTTTVIDSIPVPYTDSAELKKFRDSLDYYRFAKDSLIIVPKHIEVIDPEYHIDATVTKTSLLINNIALPDSQYLRIVENKGGFFKKVNGKLKFHVPKMVEFQSFHTNSHIHVTGQNSILYQPNSKSKWFGKALLIGVGFAAGKLL